MKIFKATLIVFLFSQISCTSLKLFTTEVRDNYELQSQALQSIQFYVDAPFILHRIEENVSRSLTDQHSLESKLSKYEEEIIIDKKTPGVAIKSDNDTIVIDFGEEIFCKFSTEFSDIERKKLYLLECINDQPVIKTNAERNELWHSKIFGGPKMGYILPNKINLNGKKYEVIFEVNNNYINWPGLLFDEAILKDYEKDTKEIKGRKLN